MAIVAALVMVVEDKEQKHAQKKIDPAIGVRVSACRSALQFRWSGEPDPEPLSAHRGLRKPAGIRRLCERSAHAGFSGISSRSSARPTMSGFISSTVIPRLESQDQKIEMEVQS
jgi:hypothetical protein